MLITFGSVGNTSINEQGPVVESGENVSPFHFAYNEFYIRLNPVLWGESSAATNVKYVQFQCIMFVFVFIFHILLFLSYFSLITFLSKYFELICNCNFHRTHFREQSCHLWKCVETTKI